MCAFSNRKPWILRKPVAFMMLKLLFCLVSIKKRASLTQLSMDLLHRFKHACTPTGRRWGRLPNSSLASVGMTTSFLWRWHELSASQIPSCVCVNLVPSAKAKASPHWERTSASHRHAGASLEDFSKLINAAIKAKSWFCLSARVGPLLLDWSPPPSRVLPSNYCHRCNQSMEEKRPCKKQNYTFLSVI